MLNPTEDHQCDPRGSLCGKGHLTGDKQCREWFKTPYLLKKRYGERVQHQQQGTKQPRDDSTPTKSDHQGNRSCHETLRTRQDNATPTREIRRRKPFELLPKTSPSGRETQRTSPVTVSIKNPGPVPHRGRGNRRHHKRRTAAPEERQQTKV
ncbi:hypothetical protein HPB49_026030 [Dermacentor silvarum]|nr:hypothetical protein HPB49_026030 [Dermacentor silvarum]